MQKGKCHLSVLNFWNLSGYLELKFTFFLSAKKSTQRIFHFYETIILVQGGNKTDLFKLFGGKGNHFRFLTVKTKSLTRRVPQTWNKVHINITNLGELRQWKSMQISWRIKIIHSFSTLIKQKKKVVRTALESRIEKETIKM